MTAKVNLNADHRQYVITQTIGIVHVIVYMFVTSLILKNMLHQLLLASV